jgi:hypothetical protein
MPELSVRPEQRLQILSDYIWELAHQNPERQVRLHSLLYDLSIIVNGNPQSWINEKSLKERAKEIP